MKHSDDGAQSRAPLKLSDNPGDFEAVKRGSALIAGLRIFNSFVGTTFLILLVLLLLLLGLANLEQFRVLYSKSTCNPNIIAAY